MLVSSNTKAEKNDNIFYPKYGQVKRQNQKEQIYFTIVAHIYLNEILEYRKCDIVL